MFQKQRQIRLPLAGALLLGLLAGIALLAWSWLAHSESSEGVTKHTVDTSPEDALKYWTADRMRKAKATNMPQIDAPGRKQSHSRRPPQTPGSQKS
jgi:hypothetical protein